MPRRPASARSGAGKGDLPDGFCGCPIDAAFAVLGKKWAVQLLRNLLQGDRHFNELLAHIEGLNPKTLSARLKELGRERLVAKRIVATSPVRIEYLLTEKGYAVFPLMRTMARWSLRWAPERVFADGRLPQDVEACLEAWQEEFFPDGEELEFRRAPDVVSAAPRRRAARSGSV